MSKKTIGLIVVLFLVTVILFAVALTTTTKSQTQQTATIPTPTPTPYAQSMLNFSPNVISLPLNKITKQTVNVLLNTGANHISGVQLELSFDPKVLTNVSATPGAMFLNPQIVTNNVDTQDGRISFAYTLSTPAIQNSAGIAAVLTFMPNPNALDAAGKRITQTTISLLAKSEVTQQGITQSVLNQTSFTNIATISFVTPTPVPTLQSSPSAQTKLSPSQQVTPLPTILNSPIPTK